MPEFRPSHGKVGRGCDNRKNSWYATQSHCYDRDLLAGMLGSTAAIRKVDTETWRSGTGLCRASLAELGKWDRFK